MRPPMPFRIAAENRLILIAILAAGLNLRLLFTSTGTLLSSVQHTLGLSSLGAGVLTGIPALCMGLVALVGSRLICWLGIGPGPQVALLIIAGGTLARLGGLLPGVLFLSTVVAGLGIASVQVLIPAVVKQYFPYQGAMMMGLYTTAMNIGAAAGANFSQPLAQALGGWPAGLAAWGLLAAASASIWPRRLQLDLKPHIRPLPWRNRQGWQIAILLGSTSIPYMSILAWLVPYFQDLGWPNERAAHTLTIFAMAQIAAALLTPAIAHRFWDRRPLLICSLLSLTAGLTGLLTIPTLHPWLWVSLAGMGLGACFPLTLTLPIDYSDTPEGASQLTAMAFGIGMLWAGPGSTLFGFLRDHFEYKGAWLFLIATSIFCTFFALTFKPRTITNPTEPKPNLLNAP